MSDRDLFRDSPLRYLGYSNEIGEAFRPLVSRSIVNLSYGIAISYVCADTADKTIKSHNNGNPPLKSAIIAGDVLIWQLLASVLIPGVTINRVTWATRKVLQRTRASKTVIKSAPTMVGLLCIPMILHPIDRLVDNIMNYSYRKWFI